jgi:GH18 family chitinase
VGGTIERTFEPPFPAAGERFYVTYDDSASIAEKIAWTKSLGLGGVMVFDLWRGWDAKAQPSRREPLLRSAVRALNAR